MIDCVKMGKRIAKLRREAGLTQDQMADKLFVTRQLVSKWEQGLGVATVEMLLNLCELLHTSFEYVLGLDDAPDKGQKEEL